MPPQLFAAISRRRAISATKKRLLPRRCRTHSRFTPNLSSKEPDSRVEALGPLLEDQYALVREKYRTPKHPIVLAHGLFGFEELRLAGPVLPGVQYWRGILEALKANGVEVYTATVPPSASIEERAERLRDVIQTKAGGQNVNIIAHSMGGLDSRYMISRLKPQAFKVLSLTTIASPHRGSEFADHMFHRIGPTHLSRIFYILRRLGIPTGAFTQLTRRYMQGTFNARVADDPRVRYFSYGATLTPTMFSVFRQSHQIVAAAEGANDGLVSVASSAWGQYQGTLVNVSHLDLINWTNRLRWWMWALVGRKRKFNAVAFYLGVADMLAKEGL